MFRIWSHALIGLAAAALLGGPAGAQQAPARLKGSVVDAATRRPLPAVRVALATTGRFVLSDSAGAFDMPGIPTGINRIIFSAEGFPRVSVVLAFAPGEVMDQRFELDSSSAIPDTVSRLRTAQPVSPVEVVAEPSRGTRYADFERRMRTGRGQYVTREQIEAANYNRLSDALRVLRGVTVDCGGTLGCVARMTRAPMRCFPDYVVDGQVNNYFGPQVAIRDIEGVEVYTGAADVPGEFAGRNAGCGVIVIWTRSGPPRR